MTSPDVDIADDAAADDRVTLEAAAVRLLAAREHSRYELDNKLRRRGYAADSIDEVLCDLEQRELLSDQRYADAYLRQRTRKGYGPLRIRAELAERGVSAQHIETAMHSAGVAWDRLLDEVAVARYGADDVVDYRTLAKRARQLQQRGFPSGMVRRYLDRLRIVD